MQWPVLLVMSSLSKGRQALPPRTRGYSGELDGPQSAAKKVSSMPCNQVLSDGVNLIKE